MISGLPIELVRIVLSMVSSRTDLSAMACVSRKISVLARERLFETIHITKQTSKGLFNFLSTNKEYFKHIKYLCIDGISTEDTCNIISHCQNIKHLKVKMMSNEDTIQIGYMAGSNDLSVDILGLEWIPESLMRIIIDKFTGPNLKYLRFGALKLAENSPIQFQVGQDENTQILNSLTLLPTISSTSPKHKSTNGCEYQILSKEEYLVEILDKSENIKYLELAGIHISEEILNKARYYVLESFKVSFVSIDTRALFTTFTPFKQEDQVYFCSYCPSTTPTPPT